MRKVFGVVIMTLSLVHNAFGQLGGNFIPNYTDYLTRIAPSSPTAAAFQKYGDIPVDITSGSQQISLPITTLKVGNFSWPLSLSYHSNGVKVSDVATSEGLGWVLNGIGMISQKPVGPDDLLSLNTFDTVARYLNLGINTTGAAGCTYGDDAEYGIELANGTANGLPDLFYLNEPNHNLKFFIKANDSGYAMPASAIKIKFIRNVVYGSQKWEMQDEQGNSYFFGTVGGNVTASSCSNNSSHNLSLSSGLYYLDKIITNQKQEINFIYSSETFTYTNPKDETEYQSAVPNCTLCNNSPPSNYSCTSTSISHEKRLDSIKCSTGEFVALKYSSRLDIAGSYKLDTVIRGYQLNSNPVLLQKWNLTYGYFNSGATSVDSLRLKLTGFKKLGLNNGDLESYSFEYDSTALPSRLSFAVDTFGFYNGKISNTTFLTTHADRSLSSSYFTAGILTKIHYPTGGYTTFQYGLNRVCGGTQIEKVSDYDGGGNISNIKSYLYKYSTVAPITFRDQYTTHVTTNTFQNTAYCGAFETDQCNGTLDSHLYQYKCDWYRYHSSFAGNVAYSTFTSAAKFDTVYEYFGNVHENGYHEYVLGYPKNFVQSAYLGIDNQIIKTNTFKLNSNGSYSIVHSKIDSFSVLDQASQNYFAPTSDPRQHYTYGAIIEIDREEIETPCNSMQTDCTPRLFLQNYVYLSSSPLYKTAETNIDYVNNGISIDSLKTVQNYFYSNKAQYNPIQVVTRNSKGEQFSVNKRYVTDVVAALPHNIVYDSLFASNRGGVEVSDSLVKEPGTLLAQSLTNYDFWTNGIIQPISIYKALYNNPLDSEVIISSYDTRGNLIQGKGKDGIVTTYLYGYNYNYPVAKITGADYNQVMSKLSALGATNDSRYVALQNITDQNTLRTTLSGLRSITNAFATVYTYSPFIGVSSETDPLGSVTYYEYDAMARLSLVRDQDSNIIKKYCYNYAGQQEDCGLITYYNTQKSGTFTKNNCAIGGTGNVVTYTVAANTYSSLVSQAEADQLAQNDVNTNGQAYANANGICTWYNVVKSGTFTRSNCLSGYVGSSVTYTVAAGTYSSTTSQAAADQLAQNDVNANGQTYANTNGTCTQPTIYARFEYTDYYTEETGTYATVLLRFYSDANCTNSYSVSNLTVNYQKKTVKSIGLPITVNSSVTCSGTQYSFGVQNIEETGIGAFTVTYTVTAGTGYVAKTSL